MRGPLSQAQRAGGEVAVAGQPARSRVDALLDAGIVAGAVDDDVDGVRRAAGEVALQREQPLLGHRVVGKRRGPRGAHLQPEDRGGEREQEDGGGDQAERRAAHDGEHGAPPVRPLLAGGGRDATPEPRHLQPVDAVAEDHQDRGVERQRDDDRDQPDDDGPQAEAAQRGVRHEQHRDHRQREGGAAEDDGAGGGVGDGQDRLARSGAVMAFLAQAGDDEQRVVDPERQAHRDDHVHDEQVQRERLADHGGDAEGDDDRDDRHQHRDRDADERADDQQQHDERGGQPELQLALAQVAAGQLGEVAIERVGAGDVRGEASAAVGALNEGDQVGDPLVLRLGDHDGQHRGVPVGRDQDPAAGVQVAGDLLHGAAATGLRDHSTHVGGKGGIGDDRALGAHDDDLVDRVLTRQPRVDQILRGR